MKILLQHKRTHQYVQTVDAWTRSEAQAHNFMNSQNAIAFAHEHDLTDVYVTVKFLGVEDVDVSVPIPETPRFPQSRLRLF
jgi:hypothetical protein